MHRIELQEKERDMLEHVVAGQTVKNVVLPAAGVAFVGSASYLTYKALKSLFEWTDDVPQQLWDATILSSKNREEFRKKASNPEYSPYSGEGPTQKEILTRTFHFWTGGLFQK